MLLLVRGILLLIVSLLVMVLLMLRCVLLLLLLVVVLGVTVRHPDGTRASSPQSPPRPSCN